MPLMTSFSSLSHPNFLPRRGSVNSPNQWKSLEARSGLLRGLGSNSHFNSRNIQYLLKTTGRFLARVIDFHVFFVKFKTVVVCKTIFWTKMDKSIK